MTLKTDYLIIGAGIIGLTIGRELQRRDPGADITVIDKESSPGQHASGRNSGVLHSGIYYPADSLKARFARDGNRAWREYCESRGLPLDECGKLIVVRNEVEHGQLATLEERGAANGVAVHRVDEVETCAIEPRAKTFGDALFVPSTATADPGQLIAAQQADFIAQGGTLRCNHPYKGHEGDNKIRAGNERIRAGTVINCGGLYADKVAQDFGFGHRYMMLPFKGLYLYAASGTQAPRTHIYPVPDLRNPFLGLHLTRTLDGGTKIGPTAIPALWREHYGGLAGFRARELMEVVSRELHMLLTNRNDFRTLAWQELCKQSRRYMISDASTLMADIDSMGFQRWGRPGIRPQLVERADNKFAMDFVVEGDERSIHVLNAISPAWTCAIPFADHVVNQLLHGA